MNLLPETTDSRALPTFICVGAAKCGTTSLYQFLKSHPNVYMSPVKEPNFFSTDVRVVNFREDYKCLERDKAPLIKRFRETGESSAIWGMYMDDAEEYLKLFRAGTEFTARGEISNSYLYSEQAAQNIKDSVPGVMIIVMLRNPVARTFSHYRAMVRDGRSEKDNLIDEVLYDQQFADRRWGSCHGYIDVSLYSRQIERLFQVFGKERVLVLLTTEMQTNRSGTMARVFEFIGVEYDPAFLRIEDQNISIEPRSQEFIRAVSRSGLKRRISASIPSVLKNRLRPMFFKGNRVGITVDERTFLADFFADDIVRLESILGRNLDAWRRDFV